MQNALLEHSAILLTCIKLPFVNKTYFWASFEWPFKTGFTVHVHLCKVLYLQVLDLALREPPKDAEQPTVETTSEVEETQADVMEDEIEPQETDNKLKDKLTLKELASQSKVKRDSVVDDNDKTKSVTDEQVHDKDDKEHDHVDKEHENVNIDQSDTGDKEGSSQVVSPEKVKKETIEEQVTDHDNVDETDQSEVRVSDESHDQPISEPVTLPPGENQPVVEEVTDEVQDSGEREITAEEMKADLKEREAMMFQEDTTDSEVQYCGIS